MRYLIVCTLTNEMLSWSRDLAAAHACCAGLCSRGRHCEVCTS